jgi:hypothetical protein
LSRGKHTQLFLDKLFCQAQSQNYETGSAAKHDIRYLLSVRCQLSMQRATIQWIGGGLATASFACLTQILTLDLDKLSRSLHIAVLIFAISIPLDVLALS